MPPRVLGLPPGLKPDVRDGSAFASLVGFDFLETRVLASRGPVSAILPGSTCACTSGTTASEACVFICGIVPQRLVAWVARTLYGEPYYAAPIHNERAETSDCLAMTYCFTWRGRPQALHVEGAKPAAMPSASSDAHYFKEHRWGFGTTRTG